MFDIKVCEWLLENGDTPVRYRVLRELFEDKIAAKKIENELINHNEVQKWLINLRNENPPAGWYYEHGSFDVCLENALPKLVQLGLHGGLQVLDKAAEFYLSRYNSTDFRWISVNMFNYSGIIMDELTKIALDQLDRINRFTQKKTYDFYISENERALLKKVPKNWKNSNFIKPEISYAQDFDYPYIYDLLGLFRLYDLKNTTIDKKINDIIDYISVDEFHLKVQDCYGILIAGKDKYYGQGWDPKYPGWFDAVNYIENVNAPKLLFFTQIIVKYPSAVKTKWFYELIKYLETYKTNTGTYIFPKEWLKETQGYAVMGHHLSFGENRRKKNWCEIESTIYMQLLLKNI